jgi:hypothetical protein
MHATQFFFGHKQTRDKPLDSVSISFRVRARAEINIKTRFQFTQNSEDEALIEIKDVNFHHLVIRF